MLKIIETLLKKYLSLQPEKRQMSGSTSRSGNDTLTVETGVRIPYPIPGRIAKRRFFFYGDIDINSWQLYQIIYY